MSAKQLPEIKNNPWLVEMLGDNKARVPSASGDGRAYVVDLETGFCPCDAHGPCWHLDCADLRARLDTTMSNCRRMYSRQRLPDLIAEDERLRGLLAEQESHSLRAQLTVLGDAVGVLIDAAPAAA